MYNCSVHPGNVKDTEEIHFEISQILMFHDLIGHGAPKFDHNHPKPSNYKHDLNPIKYLNVLHYNRTQKQWQPFLLCIAKIIRTFYFAYFGNVCLLSSKTIIQFEEVLMFICMQNLISISNFFLETL